MPTTTEPAPKLTSYLTSPAMLLEAARALVEHPPTDNHERVQRMKLAHRLRSTAELLDLPEHMGFRIALDVVDAFRVNDAMYRAYGGDDHDNPVRLALLEPRVAARRWGRA